jgi:hypothetical protein
MLLDFPLIQLFRSIISKLFRQGFFELITIEPAIWRRYLKFSTPKNSLATKKTVSLLGGDLDVFFSTEFKVLMLHTKGFFTLVTKGRDK